ncbi:MAG TPA: M20/M25/M40 family metallo-hydrolase [Xanthobacteraceae bacterium]|nr:M20/M25/M40 family metallo-hydrolase [Xanthobacteraceae bacterium]
MALSRVFRSTCIVTVVVLAAVSRHCTTWAQSVSGPTPETKQAPAASAGAFRHLQALQEIASANGGNRAAGTRGYDRSAEYVAQQLKEAGYTVRFEEFEFPFFEERTPPVLAISRPDGSHEPASANAIRTLVDSGSGDVTARLRAVNLQLGATPLATSNSGCQTDDFREFERGAVALVRRGTCQFHIKVEHAVAAGAVGVVIMNEGTEGRMDAFAGRLSKPASIPVVGVSYAFGSAIVAQDGVATVHLAINAVSGMRPSRNVVAETSSAGDDPWIVVGAHLDSVPEGPGINDNGSGSAAVLEAALQLAHEQRTVRGHMRFAFWGAEERGLIGSRHHVNALSEEERRHIALYINLDMVGSPNFIRFVQGPAVADEEPAAVARREFIAAFRERNLNVEERNGRRFGSDDSSFSEKNIPTVGLYTGAGGSKSQTQVSLFGGTAGRPFDPCYHQACDTIDNIDRYVLEQNTGALVRALNAVAVVTRAPDPPDRKAGDQSQSKR